MVNSTMWTPSERTWENCSVLRVFYFYFLSLLCALWQLSFEYPHARPHPTSPQRDHEASSGERLGAAQVPRGVVGQACKVSSPQIAELWIILCYDELFGKWVVDDAKDQRRDRYALLAETSTDSSLAIAPPVLVRLSADGKMQARVGVPASTMQPPAGRLGA